MAAEQFPGAVRIVDVYHAKQHLCDVAKAICGPGLADRWARDRRAELDASRLRAVVAALPVHVETTSEARTYISVRVREPPPDALSAVDEVAYRNAEYDGRVVLEVSVVRADGEPWSFGASGTAENYGRPGNPANYQETINHALDRAASQAVSNAGFHRRLCAGV